MVAFFRQPIVWQAVIFVKFAVLLSLWVIHLSYPLPLQSLLSTYNQWHINEMVLVNNTLPRMVMALLVGGSVSLVTLLLQQAMRNPLASDSTLAVSSGAKTALLLTTVFIPSTLSYGVVCIAMVGAFSALLLVLWIAHNKNMQPLAVVLAGLVTTLYLSAISSLITLLYSEEARSVIQWASGSLVQDSWHDTIQLTWQLSIIIIAVLILLKPLSIMTLGDEHAQSLGIPVQRIRLFTLLLAAFLSACVVSVVGVMGFIGLTAVTLVNQNKVRHLKEKLLYSMLFGSLLLLVTDNLLVLIKHFYEIDWPAGAMSGLFGAPLLLWLMKKTTLPVDTPSAGEVKYHRSTAKLSWLITLLAMLFLIALFIGHQTDGWFISVDSYLLKIRYPRILLAMSCGIMLAVSGVLLQRLTLNPMASPELLGISSGTALGVMSAVLVFNIALGSFIFFMTGITTALLTLIFILWLNHKNGMNPQQIVLTGLALVALSGAALNLWSVGGDLRIQQLVVWLSGSTYQATPSLSIVTTLIALILLLISLCLSRWLALLGLNTVIAQSVGINIILTRFILIIFSAILTAIATLLIGPLSFIGLLAPHMATMLGGRLVKQQLIIASLIGAIVMVSADWLGRQVIFPYEIPAGLVSTLMGGVYFLWLMKRLS